jgi:hypothetical protein
VSGELCRARFRADSEEAVEWLQALPELVDACYEAGGAQIQAAIPRESETLRKPCAAVVLV